MVLDIKMTQHMLMFLMLIGYQTLQRPMQLHPSGGKKDPTGSKPNPNLDTLPKGVQLDWSKFLDGGYVLNSGATEGATAGQPYISGAPTDGRPNPKAIVILPSDDGKGYFAQDLDAAVEEYITRIPNIAKESYKKKLKDYYPYRNLCCIYSRRSSSR
jgi:hypothetical protein